MNDINIFEQSDREYYWSVKFDSHADFDSSKLPELIMSGYELERIFNWRGHLTRLEYPHPIYFATSSRIRPWAHPPAPNRPTLTGPGSGVNPYEGRP